MLGETCIPKGSAAGREQFERRIEQRRQGEAPGDWKALRRGWCYGAEEFRTGLLPQMSERIGRHYGGSERLEAAEVKAQCLLADELARRGWNAAHLEERRKGDKEKSRSPGDGAAKRR